MDFTAEHWPGDCWIPPPLTSRNKMKPDLFETCVIKAGMWCGLGRQNPPLH